MDNFYTLDLLPLPRFDDPTITVTAARAKWQESLRLVDAVAGVAMTLGGDLRQKLDNLRFYLATGLRQLEAFVEMGGSGLDTVSAVDNLAAPRDSFLRCLPATRELFNWWRAEAAPQSGLSGTEDDAAMTSMTESLLAFSKPKDDSKLFLGLMVAGALALAVYTARG